MHTIFQTPRLIFRQFTLDDASLIQQLNSNPEVLKYLHEPALQTEAEALEILKSIILPQYKNKLGRWAMHIKENNEFIGWCGLKYRPESDEIDLGYRLKQTAWGNGYATEAARHTLQYAFETLQLPKIIGRVHIENTASIKVLEKIGMIFEKEEEVDSCPVKTYVAYNCKGTKK